MSAPPAAAATKPKPSADPTAINCVTVLGEHIAKPFRQELVRVTDQLSPKPKLVGILANSGAPSRAYANWTAKACEAVGIDYELREVGIVASGTTEGTAEQGEVEEAILLANQDDNVNGIMVYYPIFGPRQDGYLQQAVSPLKDVEGLNFTWCVALSSSPSSCAARSIPPRCRRSYHTARTQALLAVPQHALHRPAQARPRRPGPHPGTLRPERGAGRPLDVQRTRRLAAERGWPRQGDPALHAPRHRQDARALPGLQPAAPVRLARVRPHHHGRQPVRGRRSSSRGAPLERRRARLLCRPRRHPGVHPAQGRQRVLGRERQQGELPPVSRRQKVRAQLRGVPRGERRCHRRRASSSSFLPLFLSSQLCRR